MPQRPYCKYVEDNIPRLCSVGFVDSGEGCGSVTELPEVSSTGMKVLQNFQKFRVLWHERTELTEVPGWYKKCYIRTPGIVARGVQNSQKFRVRVLMPYRTNRSPGTGMKVLQNFQSSGYCGTGVQNLQKFPVRV